VNLSSGTGFEPLTRKSGTYIHGLPETLDYINSEKLLTRQKNVHLKSCRTLYIKAQKQVCNEVIIVY